MSPVLSSHSTRRGASRNRRPYLNLQKMRPTRVAILVLLACLSTGVAVHILDSKGVTKDASKTVEPDVKDLAYASKNRDQLADTSVWLIGRVFTDGGGYHWLVNSLGDDPDRTYAIRLSAWPFRFDPPIGTWSTVVQIFGRFEKSDPGSNYDFIMGPTKIIPSDAGRPGEPIAPWIE